MDFQEIMKELEALGTERTKNIYMKQGAKEPLYGVATGAMKPILRAVKINQKLAEELYATGNYDAMYLAGMIADPKVMTGADFDTEKLSEMLDTVEKTIHLNPERAQHAMNYFVTTLGVSYLPLHEKALSVAKRMDSSVAKEIEKAVMKGRIGFKRKHVRC